MFTRRSIRTRTAVVVAALAALCGLAVAPAAAAAPAPSGGSAPHVCDPIDPAGCLLPFPNDWFTVPDSGTATGRRVAMSRLAMPRSAGLVPIDPAQWNRNDGFSPGSMLLARVPGLDLARTGAAPITDIARSLDRDAPIVLLDARTGERVPYWAELDANAPESRQALIVRPARNLREGHRHLVLLRDLKRADGSAIAPGGRFADLLDGEPWWSPDRERSDALRRTVRHLRDHGVSTRGANLAWDFTVASTRGLTERALHMRDESFAALGEAAPRFSVAKVTEPTPEQDPDIARQVEGTVEVPSYLNLPGGPPGSSMHYGADGLPEQLPGNVQRANFRCNVPRKALTEPALPVMYGHGLLGSAGEIDSGALKRFAQQHNMLVCATDWIGMAQGDIPHVISLFADFSRWNTVPDRQQQSYLDFLFLGRAMIHSGGLGANPAFRNAAGEPVIDRAAGLRYAGASQGGIQGAALTALAQDFTRSALIVPAINYSTMLNRSVDFDQFQTLMNIGYPDKLDQQLIFALLQMLWDRGEGNGYAAHLTGDPLPGTPRHRVLLQEAFGDHQVANIGTEVMARTIQGTRVHQPALGPGRSPDVTPFWDIPAIGADPYAGSALVMWDSGSPPPPLTNTSGHTGQDPHGHTRNSPEAMRQLAHFLRTGEVIDTCAGAPCTIQPPA